MAISQLQSQLWRIKARNNDNVHFVPQESLANVFNKDNVRAALQEAELEPHRLATTTKIILQQAQRIFATLLDIRSADKILRFIEVDHLQTRKLDDILPMRDKSLDFLDDETAERFYEAQWRYCVPIFSPNFQHRELADDTILPYLESRYVSQGTFGTVYEVEIHPTHVASSSWERRQVCALIFSAFDFENLTSDCRIPLMQVARKEIAATAKDSMANELRILTSLTSIRHPNILELLGSYTYRGKHNFLFPLADTDLEMAFKLDDQLLGFPDKTSLFLALPDLASALEKIHAYTSEDMSWIGCHHDIKPDNILVIRSRLVIADFGLCTLKGPSEGSKSLLRCGGHYYHAPECEDYDDDCKKGTINRASDIWSLGCVMLELLVFIFKGKTGVKEFETSRKITFEQTAWTTKTFHHGKKASPAVQRCLDELKQDGFPIFVKELARLISAMLSIEPADRPRAADVAERLRFSALIHVSQNTLDRLEEENGSESFDLVVENQRLECWRYKIASTWNPGQAASATLRNDDPYRSGIESILQMERVVNDIKIGSHNTHFCALQLRRLNDDLCKLLDSTAQAAIGNEVENRLLKLCDKLGMQGGRTTDLSDSSSMNNRIGTLYALKKMHGLVAESQSSENSRSTIERNDVYGLNTASAQNRSFSNARYASGHSEPQDIIIQWLYYDVKWAGPHGVTLFSRMESLVDFLQRASQEASLRILPCLGYYHEEKRHAFALVFSYPKSTAEKRPEMTTLDFLFREKKLRLRPGLGQVFFLVQTLARSLLEYHTIGWFHKSISPQHIVFFGPAECYGPPNIHEPYFMGFDHSRQDRPGEYSEGPQDMETRGLYQHPLYKSGKYRFCPQFDYFSLGLILLELGLWETLPSLISRHLPLAHGQEERVNLIRDNLVPLLAPRMGDTYRKACLACLGAEVGKASDQAGGHEQHGIEPLAAFRDKVLEPLSRCRL